MKPVAAIRFCLMNALVAIIILNNEFKIRRKSAVCVLINQVLIKYSSIMYAESFPIFFSFSEENDEEDEEAKPVLVFQFNLTDILDQILKMHSEFRSQVAYSLVLSYQVIFLLLFLGSYV